MTKSKRIYKGYTIERRGLSLQQDHGQKERIRWRVAAPDGTDLGSEVTLADAKDRVNDHRSEAQ